MFNCPDNSQFAFENVQIYYEPSCVLLSKMTDALNWVD